MEVVILGIIVVAIVVIFGAVIIRVQNDKEQKRHAQHVELLQALRHQGD